jgi:hypothetical protein
MNVCSRGRVVLGSGCGKTTVAAALRASYADAHVYARACAQGCLLPVEISVWDGRTLPARLPSTNARTAP